MEKDELEKLHSEQENEALAYYKKGSHHPQNEFQLSEENLKQALKIYNEWAKNMNMENKVQLFSTNV